MSTFTYTYEQMINDMVQLDSYMLPLFTTYMYCVYEPENEILHVAFSVELSTTEEEALEDALAAYPNPLFDNSIPFYYKCSGMDFKSTNSENWTTLMYSAYQGKKVESLGTLTAVVVNSALVPNQPDDSADPNDFWYEVRLVDKEDNILAFARFANAVMEDQVLPVVDAPIATTTFRMQVRKGPLGQKVDVSTYCGRYDMFY